MAGFSAWCAWSWWPAWIPAGILLAGALGAAWLATRPRIEVTAKNLVVGRQTIDWTTIRRVDQTDWVSPLVVHLARVEGQPLRILYPGHADHCRLLLRLIQQRCTHAEKAAPVPPRIVSDADAAEVERMFQILRSAGRLDSDDK